MRTYSAIDVDLVLEWADKYVEICALLKKVFAAENTDRFCNSAAAVNRR